MSAKLKKKNSISSLIKARPSLANEIQSPITQSQGNDRSLCRKRKHSEKAEGDAEKYVDNKLSQKILQAAQQQLREVQGDKPPSKRPAKSRASAAVAAASAGKSAASRHGKQVSDDDEDEEWEDADCDGSDSDPGGEGGLDPAYDPADDLARQLYTDKTGPLGQLDAEQLRLLITEKQSEIQSELLTDAGSDAGASRISCLPDSVREHFESCRAVLRQYRSGKLPKPIKQLPHFGQWQELVEMLEPSAWTAAAMCAVTKYFASKGKSTALQFYQGYLLPRCRDDISEYRRLNFHLYSALRKALFRQREFFCGLLLPWARDAVSLPEATILGGLLRRVSIPVKYAAPALHMLLQMPYSGGRAILVRVLLEKKYNLPDPVLGQALAHFVAMETDSADHLNEDGRLPVLWHQALLALVERYGAYFRQAERERVLRLCRQHLHPDITPAIRQALGQLQQRDAAMETAD